MGNRILGITIAVACAFFIHNANAQINLSADVINFRASLAADGGKLTQHFGRMDVQANSGVSGYALKVTESSTSATAIYGNAYTSGSIAGYFKGGAYGIQGWATLSGGTGVRMGAYLQGSGGSINYGIKCNAASAGTTNYGIYATAAGATTNWAGYFDGPTWCSAGIFQGSDEKIKRDIVDMDSSLDKIMKLSPKNYYYDTVAYPKMGLNSKKQHGLIAQDVEKIFPELVAETVAPDTTTETPNNMNLKNASSPEEKQDTIRGVNYTALVPVLISAMQEQQKQIDELKKTVKILRGY